MRPLARLALVPALLVPAIAQATIPTMRVRGPDFGGDGYADLAVGATTGPAGDRSSEVRMLYGSAAGLDLPAGSTEAITSAGMPGDVEDGFWSPFLFAWGDFDGDCIDDLVVTDPCDASDGETSWCRGVASVHYGSATGPSDTSDLDLDGEMVGGQPGASDAFGLPPAVGDFDGDGFDDLAIAAPRVHVGRHPLGAVLVLYGGPDGLQPRSSQVLFDETPSRTPHVTGYGADLAAGDFDCDGHDDLAIYEVGGLAVVYGGANGLSAIGSPPDEHFTNAQLGNPSMGMFTAGNFDGNVDLAPGGFGFRGCMDLAIGGDGVTIVYGMPSDDVDPGLQVTTKAPDEFVGPAGFGRWLSIGRFDANAYDDLAVVYDGGARVLLGSSSGLVELGGVDVEPDSAGPATYAAIGFGDFTDDGRGDLVLGNPQHEDGCAPFDCGTFAVADFAAAGLAVVIDATLEWFVDDLPGAPAPDTTSLGFRATAGRSRFEPACLDLDPPP